MLEEYFDVARPWDFEVVDKNQFVQQTNSQECTQSDGVSSGGGGGGGGSDGGSGGGSGGGGAGGLAGPPDEKEASVSGMSDEEIRARTPDDIPDLVSEDIVAKQLREAALAEEDPELRERLWEEYRMYNGL